MLDLQAAHDVILRIFPNPVLLEPDCFTLHLEDNFGNTQGASFTLNLNRQLPTKQTWRQFLHDYVRAEVVNEEVLQTFAFDLYQATIVDTELKPTWEAIVNAATPCPLQLTVEFGKDTAAAALPWELFHDEYGYVFYKPGSSLQRVPSNQRAAPPRIPDEPRVLLGWACPPLSGDVFDPQPHIDVLRKIFGDRLTVFDQVQEQQLREELQTARTRESPYHYLVVLAHGHEGGVCLTSASGGPAPLSAQQLGLCVERQGLSLAFLCSCKSSVAPDHAFASVGQQLLARQGSDIPCVIATQANLPIHGSAALMKHFFEELAQCRQPATALANARRESYGGIHITAWSVPVCLLRRATHPASNPPKPKYPDEFTKTISEEMRELRQQKRQLAMQIGSAEKLADLDSKLADLRSQLRKGPPLVAGDCLSNRYYLIESLGSGGFGTVWKAYDEEIEKLVALKVLHAHYYTSEQRRERFRRGEKALRELNHPHIVRIHETNQEDGGYQFFVMDYLDGGNFAMAVAANRLLFEQRVEVIRQIGEALSFAHGKDVIHRDVTPDNILLANDGTACLADFDLVRLPDSSGGTRTGSLGKFIYAAPETLEAAAHVDARCDVFSLGMTAVFACYGQKLPSRAFANPAEFIDQLHCSQAVKQVLIGATVHQVENRYGTVEVFCRELSTAASEVVRPSQLVEENSSTPPTKEKDDAGQVPFPSQFVFPNGQSCRNFDELAMTCHNNWESASDLLHQGFFAGFLGGLGRTDLAMIAREAAKFPGKDRGLDQLLAKLPSKVLQPPKLNVTPSTVNLGTVLMDSDRQFELILENQGMRLLFGTVVADTKWLALDVEGQQQMLFQFRDKLAVPVHVLGKKLRAGPKPLMGKISVESNDGATQTLTVNLNVPVKPFPAGSVLAGAVSPREVAVKARESPKESAVLFEDGSVERWFKDNGWIYPVQGPAGSGLGAVQQFFESLGLAKAPKVSIDTTSLELRGRTGEQLKATIRVETSERRPVYAHATSDAPWLDIIQTTVERKGRCVQIHICVPSVPMRLGNALTANIRIAANGNQRFHVPVTLAIEDVPSFPVPPVPVGPVPIVPATAPAIAVSTKSPLQGTFWMSKNGKNARKKITIKHNFWISDHLVTQIQWQRIMGNNPSWFSRHGGGRLSVKDISDDDLRHFPVEQVSWNDAQDFLEKLNEKFGGKWLYRLPTEEEWEFACRAGAVYKVNCSFDYYLQSGPSNSLSPQQANFGGHVGRPTKVGMYEPNALGIYDMHGNVSEWTATEKDKHFLQVLGIGGGANSGQRVLRGGSWDHPAESVRAAHRDAAEPEYRSEKVGFRLVAVSRDG